MKRTMMWVVIILAAFVLGWFAKSAGRGASKGDARLRPDPGDVSFTAVGGSMLFFDRASGDLWVYTNPEKPARHLGRLDSFDKPLVTAAIKAQYENLAANPEQPAPAAQTLKAQTLAANPLIEKYNALPKSLWPTADENEFKRQARDQWVEENIKPSPETFTGKITFVSQVKDKIQLRLEVEKAALWGKEVPLYVTATFETLKPSDVIDWKTGQTLTLSGVVTKSKPGLSIMSAGYAYVDVTLDRANVK